MLWGLLRYAVMFTNCIILYNTYVNQSKALYPEDAMLKPKRNIFLKLSLQYSTWNIQGANIFVCISMTNWQGLHSE